jgi:TonB family protein
MVRETYGYVGDIGLVSLVRSPFLIPSVLLHVMLFLLALRATLSIARPQTNVPISVQLMEVKDGGSDNKSIGLDKGTGGPRTLPKLGVPTPPAQRTGKLDSGSTESLAPSKQLEEAPPPPKPATLPGPKVLATTTPHDSVNVKETSPDSLVRLPTKESSAQLPGGAAADLETNQKNPAALKANEGPGVRALKEGYQVPGALKGTGSGAGPYGVPGGNPSGTGVTGGGTGVGTGGGSNTGLKGLPSSDYDQYLKQIEKRVRSVWKYPDDVTGAHKVTVRFTLDRAGKLAQAEVLESSDSRLNASAVEAMKRASPFPPIPESLKDLANEPMIMRFAVSIRVRG